MISIPHKTKIPRTSIKVLIVAGAFYFIYNQLANNDKLDWVQFMANSKKPIIGCRNWFILLLSVLNRYFEILKWQNLASYIKPISVLEATKQVLAVTAGILHQMRRRICRKSIVL
jgi:hypothetical protein